MKVYIVFYYNHHTEAWTIGNVYSDYKRAQAEADKYAVDSYVEMRVVL